MLTIGIANLLLALVGIYSLLSASWQLTTNHYIQRVYLAWACWSIAVLVGILTCATRAQP